MPAEIKFTKLKRPLEARRLSSLVNFKGKFIFLIGGVDVRDIKQTLDSVHKYDIESNKWSMSSTLNHARGQHSSCTLNDFIYAFYGLDYENFADSIERLNGIEAISGRKIGVRRKKW